MKIYISGKITGLPLEEARANFKKTENDLRKNGHTPVNPMEIVKFDKSKTWQDYMIEDIKLLFNCEAILMLDNYRDSKGAKIELAIAKELGLKIIYQMNF